VLLLNGLSFVAVIVALLMMRIPRGEAKRTQESPWRNFTQGFRFAMADLPIRSALLLLSVLSLFGLQYSVFLPIYAHDILHGGVGTQGLLMTAAGVGALLGALQFAARTHYKGLAPVIGATCTTCAVALIIFSQARVFWLCAGVLFVMGFATTTQMAANEHHPQERVPDHMRRPVDGRLRHHVHGLCHPSAPDRRRRGQACGDANTILLFGLLVLTGCLFFITRVVMKVNKTGAATAVA